MLRDIGRALILTICLTASAAAETTWETHLYAGFQGGYAVRNAGDLVDEGYGFNVGFGVIPHPLSTGDVEVILRVHGDYFPAASDKTPNIGFYRAGLDWKLNLSPNNRRNVFLVLEGGYCYTRWTEYPVAGKGLIILTENSPFLSLGIGLECRAKKVTPFLELRATDVSGKRVGDYQFGALSLGVRF
ncbi:MAG: hypothetical protein KKA42_05780 [candidate division Zixibacteria bacterium]|nr:hypothetical protein [candidate division Zixibacteria bacterium]